MKIVIASLTLAAAGLMTEVSPAKAESTYWQDRWQGRGYYDPQAYPSHRRDRAGVRGRTRAPRGEAAGAEPYAKRSYNGPVYQSQEEVQQSVYEFSTGGFGNIKSYR